MNKVVEPLRMTSDIYLKPMCAYAHTSVHAHTHSFIYMQKMYTYPSITYTYIDTMAESWLNNYL